MAAFVIRHRLGMSQLFCFIRAGLFVFLGRKSARLLRAKARAQLAAGPAILAVRFFAIEDPQDQKPGPEVVEADALIAQAQA